MTEFSRARRAARELQTASSPKSQTSSKKETVSNSRIPPSSPQIPNTSTVSHLSLLNKVYIDTTIEEKNSIQRSSLEIIPENTGPTIKSASTTSQDVTLKLNQTFTKTTSSISTVTMPQRNQDNNQRKDDLNFSITNIIN
jgi:hypothetical protein